MLKYILANTNVLLSNIAVDVNLQPHQYIVTQSVHKSHKIKTGTRQSPNNSADNITLHQQQCRKAPKQTASIGCELRAPR
ncbi:hypothetical protein BASA81_014592 [Batrachochytrium salamandrivorans]|nr:hypothetical protein BASA81_014592 [Batrachochytrium salamandrivorans]